MQCDDIYLEFDLKCHQGTRNYNMQEDMSPTRTQYFKSESISLCINSKMSRVHRRAENTNKKDFGLI